MKNKVMALLMIVSMLAFITCSSKKKNNNNLLLLGLAYLSLNQYEATISLTGKIRDASGNALLPVATTAAPSTDAIKYITVTNPSGSSLLTSTDTVKDFSTIGTSSSATDYGNFTLTFKVNAATGSLTGTAYSCTGCSTTVTAGVSDFDSASKYTTTFGTFKINLNLSATGGTDVNQVTFTDASGLTVTVVSVSVSIKGQYNLQSPTVGENICDGKSASGAGETISGSITGNKTISGSATLSGTVTVESGATLTVNAGSVVFGNRGSSLFVKQGGKLVAEGTAANPICFTSGQALGSRYPGDWGGIVLIGNGRGTRSSTTEGTSPVTYGSGTNDADSSGTLKYVIIEFAGNEVAPGDELNGLSMYTVGSGTTVDYVQVHRGLDDSFEMWGGAVNLTHVVATGGMDDDYDMDEGYVGNITYAIGQKYPTACGGSPSTDPHGIESDGVNSSNSSSCVNGTAQRCTGGTNKEGTLSYMTILGRNIESGEAARLREGNRQTLSNSVLYNFSASPFISGCTGSNCNNSGFPANAWIINNTVYIPTGKTADNLNSGVSNASASLSAVPVISEGDVANCGFAATKPDFTTNIASGAPSTVGASANGQGSWWSGWTVYRAR